MNESPIDSRPDPRVVAREILQERFPAARVIFLAGSVMRGEGTPYSDLDLVVVYDQIEAAWRESFMHRGWPIEAFVHDPESLEYFFQELDRNSGVPALPSMVAEGVPIPARSPFSERLQARARACLQAGPPPWSSDELVKSRYAITDLCEDLRCPREADELMATGARLYESLAEFAFRSEGKWSAHGKKIPWRMERDDPSFRARFHQAFDRLFAAREPGPVLELARELLAKRGGFLFDGARSEAPAAWKKALNAPASFEAPQLRTSRLLLRMAVGADVPEILRFFRDNAERFKPTEPPLPIGFLTDGYWKENIPAFDQEWEQHRALRLLIFQNDGRPEVVGRINFTQMARGPFQACFAGYSISEAFEGQGMMTEALGVAIQYVFDELNFHRIMANHLPENQKSAAVLKRLGFKTEGLASDYLYLDDRWRDHVLTALINPAWLQAF